MKEDKDIASMDFAEYQSFFEMEGIQYLGKYASHYLAK